MLVAERGGRIQGCGAYHVTLIKRNFEYSEGKSYILYSIVSYSKRVSSQ